MPDAPPTCEDHARPVTAAALSVSFWTCLLAASALLAAVALAPRIEVREELQSSLTARQQELSRLQADIARLERLEGALERNQAFAARIAEQSLASADEGSWTLSMKASPASNGTSTAQTEAADPGSWLLEFIRPLGRSPELRRQWAVGAVGLLAFGLIFLQENANSRSLRAAATWPVRRLASRYADDAKEAASAARLNEPQGDQPPDHESAAGTD